MGFDVLEVDAEVVGGVAEAIGAEVGREEFAGFLADAHSGRGHDGIDVFAGGEAAGVFERLGVKGVGGGVDVAGRPDRSGGDPFFEVGFFHVRERVAVLGHFIRAGDFPEDAFFKMAGADDVGVGEGGELLGEVEVAFRGGGIVALEAVAGEDRLDVGDEEGLATEALFLCCGEDGFGCGFAFEENLDFLWGKGAVVEGEVVDGAEPGAVVCEFVSEGEEVGVVPALEVALDSGAGGELAVEEEGGSAIG